MRSGLIKSCHTADPGKPKRSQPLNPLASTGRSDCWSIPRLRRGRMGRMAVQRTKRGPSVPGAGGPSSVGHPVVDYRAVFEQAGSAIVIANRQYKIIAANAGMCELTSYARPDLLGKHVGELMIEPGKKSVARHLAALNQSEGSTIDGTVVTRQGDHVVVEAHATGLADGAYCVVLHDVSGRVQVQEQLERSLKTYSTLVDLCHAAVISADEKGIITSWNPAAETLLGYTATEAIGLSITSMIPSGRRRSHLSGYKALLAAAREGGHGRVLSADALHKNGTQIPVELSVAVGEQNGRPIATAVIRDMTEHQRVVEKLNDALQRLEFHIERMPLAYIVWDTDFRATEWNPAAQQIFGFRKADAIGRHPYELIVPPDQRETVDRVWEGLLKGDKSSHSINANVRKDGTRITCEWFNTPLRDAAGRIQGAASMAMDISERELIEAQLRNTQKLESLGVLASGIAHDFNSLLMVIMGNTALLRSMGSLSGSALEYVELIEEAGMRANGLIKHLLAYARTGRHNPQPTDLNAVIRDTDRFVHSSIGPRHTLQFDLDEQLPAVLADRSQLEQVLLNLCLNASQACGDDGKITVATRQMNLTGKHLARCTPHGAKPGRYVEVEVKDTGCGMDPATVDRVFDPFFTTKTDGHGLGLAATLGILRQHNAVAHVESRRGKGTSFHIYFPVLEDHGSHI